MLINQCLWYLLFINPANLLGHASYVIMCRGHIPHTDLYSGFCPQKCYIQFELCLPLKACYQSCSFLHIQKLAGILYLPAQTGVGVCVATLFSREWELLLYQNTNQKVVNQHWGEVHVYVHHPISPGVHTAVDLLLYTCIGEVRAKIVLTLEQMPGFLITSKHSH